MKRKINKVGQDTLTVSLPKDWAKKNNLNKGDEVDLVVKDNALTIFGKKVMGENILEITVPEDPKAAYRLVRCYYTIGVDEIKLNFKNKKSMESIEKNMANFIGFEIIERTSNYWIIRTIADIKEGEFEKVLKRMFNLVSLMGSEIHEGFSTGKPSKLYHINDLEETLNKLYMFCSRYIITTGWKMFKNPSLYFVLVQKLENIGDNFSFLSNHYSEFKTLKINGGTVNLLEDFLKYLNDMQNYYYNFSFSRLRELLDRKDELTKKVTKLYKSVSRAELLLISKLLDTIILTYDAFSTIFDIKVTELENHTKT